MPNSYGFYRKAEDVEVRFYGMVNAHIASEMTLGTRLPELFKAIYGKIEGHVTSFTK